MTYIEGQPDIRSIFKELRQKSGLKEGETARVIGIPRETYSKWEHGRMPLKEDKLMLLAGLLCSRLPTELDRQRVVETLAPTLAPNLSASEIMKQIELLEGNLALVRHLERAYFQYFIKKPEPPAQS